MPRVRSTIAIVLCLSAVGCRARSPFEEKGPVAMRIARLAPFERRGAEPTPPEIEHWLADGASGLPAELVPPGLLVAGTPLPHWEATTPTFLSFHEIESRKTSETMARDLLAWAREEAGDESGASCMYPEFGMDVVRAGAGLPDAQVLVSLSCGHMRVFVNGEAPQDLGMSRRTRAHFAVMVARVFRSAPS